MAATAAAAAATPLLGNLPDEIVLWEILIRLDPVSLLRCRAVRRAWRCATSTRRFLLAHHARQPNLPIVHGDGYRNILAVDNRAEQLHTVAWLDGVFVVEASCDGLLVLSKFDYAGGSRTCLSVCNPATRDFKLVSPGPEPLPDLRILGMYPHRPTGEYRLLLQQRNTTDPSKHQTGCCYVFALGSHRHQPRRYVGCSETKLAFLDVAVRLRDSLHWYPLLYEDESRPWEYLGKSELIIVFDTITESFRQMRAPPVPTKSRICEMNDTLGIYSCNHATEIVDIWVLQDYESEVWDLKYRVQLPIAEIWWNFEGIVGIPAYCHVTVAVSDGDVLLLVRLGSSLFYVDTDGKLISIFRDISAYKHRLKQTLVPHDFFMTLDGYAADASPFI